MREHSAGRRQALAGLCGCALGALGLGAAGGLALALPAPARAAPGSKSALTAEQALQRLIDGNRAFLKDQRLPRQHYRDRRQEIAQTQAPFALLVSCSDSRVPPEILFRCGLGDLFVVRVAGNTIDPVALGSVEYAVAHLGVPLIVVLGHERCGAVAAALSVVESNADLPGAIGAVVAPILPAVLRARSLPGDWLDNSVRHNVLRVVEHLKTSGPLIGAPLGAGQLKIVGARYDLDEGKVDFFKR